SEKTKEKYFSIRTGDPHCLDSPSRIHALAQTISAPPRHFPRTLEPMACANQLRPKWGKPVMVPLADQQPASRIAGGHDNSDSADGWLARSCISMMEAQHAREREIRNRQSRATTATDYRHDGSSRVGGCEHLGYASGAGGHRRGARGH